MGSRSAVLTTDTCERALDAVRPLLDAQLREGALFGVSHGSLIVLDPCVSYTSAHAGGPESTGFREEVILWTHAFGDPTTWSSDFAVFARAKAFASFRHGLPSDELVTRFPYLLEPGMTKYGGSCVDPVGGLTVAFSGAAPHHDRLIGETVLAALRAECAVTMAAILADPDRHIL